MFAVRCANWAALIALAIASAGCATTYQPQTGEPTARLRVIYATQDNAPEYSVHSLDQCPADTKKVASAHVELESAQTLGMPSQVESSALLSTEIIIPAEKSLAVVMGSGRQQGARSVGCYAAFRFDPLANHDYEAVLRWLDNNRRCTINVHRLNRGVTPTRVGRSRAASESRRVEPSARPIRVTFSGPQYCAAP